MEEGVRNTVRDKRFRRAFSIRVCLSLAGQGEYHARVSRRQGDGRRAHRRRLREKTRAKWVNPLCGGNRKRELSLSFDVRRRASSRPFESFFVIFVILESSGFGGVRRHRAVRARRPTTGV